MADFLICYPTEAALDAVAQAITGLWIPASVGPDGVVIPGRVGDVRGLDGGGEWMMTRPFLYKGAWARIFRWNADVSRLAPYIAAGGGTSVVDSVTGAITITAGPVTMQTPLPADCPMSV